MRIQRELAFLQNIVFIIQCILKFLFYVYLHGNNNNIKIKNGINIDNSF